ncbi:MAG: elongation factor P [Candidatus Marinimicrobia bacterium]|nr:elongation factor P [Candidatus Neomarinimicrobiota bacterium]|tara:strand:- start:1261 stop:1824 length:564 start_codon:yes stop_codon:yes gene_type:complete
MASTADFKNGLILEHKLNLWKIIDFQHVKPGKGAAFVRSKLKNIKTGQVVEETFRAGEKISIVRVEARNYNYLFSDGSFYTFMDNETYDQIELTKSQVEDVLDFLIENTETTIAFNGNEPIEVRIPAHMNLKVVQTDPGFRGDTAQGGTKPATLETGVIIQVPLFIEKDQVVRVDTREKKYIERVKG